MLVILAILGVVLAPGMAFAHEHSISPDELPRMNAIPLTNSGGQHLRVDIMNAETDLRLVEGLRTATLTLSDGTTQEVATFKLSSWPDNVVRVNISQSLTQISYPLQPVDVVPPYHYEISFDWPIPDDSHLIIPINYDPADLPENKIAVLEQKIATLEASLVTENLATELQQSREKLKSDFDVLERKLDILTEAINILGKILKAEFPLWFSPDGIPLDEPRTE